MGTDKIHDREEEINAKLFACLEAIPNVNVLAKEHKDRLGVFSFYINNVHFNLIVKLLNDRFGIQTRGGCSCAGTYGHFLLNVDQQKSKAIEKQIIEGCSVEKPGWVRLSIHPTITNAEVDFICDGLKAVCENVEDWKNDYDYDTIQNDYKHKTHESIEKALVKEWFSN
jgi:selenocysteine lyase/cysteine desulfurase